MSDEHKSQKAQQPAPLLATDSNQRDNTHRLRL
jgi:hypothetical protein